MDDISYTSKLLGNIGEAKALSKFVNMKIPVYQAFGDNEKADLIAEFNGKLLKILVKTSLKILKNNTISFSLVSSTVHRKNGVRHLYTKDEVDYFVLYNLESDILLLLPIEDTCNKKTISFLIDTNKIYNNLFNALNRINYTFESIIKTI